MRTTVTIDSKLKKALSQAQELTKLSQAHVIRMALSAGLPAVVGRFQAPRPEGYFASDYPCPKSESSLKRPWPRLRFRLSDEILILPRTARPLKDHLRRVV